MTTTTITAEETTASTQDPSDLQRLPSVGTILYGYNVLNGEYASPQTGGLKGKPLFNPLQSSPGAVQVVSRPVDFADDGQAGYQGGDVDYQADDLLNFPDLTEQDIMYVESSSESEFKSNLTVKADVQGSYEGYSGEAKGAFSESVWESNSFYYACLHKLIVWYRVTLPGLDTLKGYLTDDFKNELNNADPQDLFDNYGTHYLNDISMGGKFRYYATVEKTATSSETDISASVKVGYNDVVASGSMKVSMSANESSAATSEVSNTKINAVGGDPSVDVTNSDSVTAWQQSIPTAPNLVDFPDNTVSLKPIWELCDDDERVQDLEDYFNTLAHRDAANDLRGCVSHGYMVDVPYGTKDDWNIFVTPATLGFSQSSDADEHCALLEFDVGINDDESSDSQWKINAQYRFRTGSDKSDVNWYEDGMANFILVPTSASVMELLPLTAPFSFPEGTTADDWNIVVSPQKFETGKNDSASENNALLKWSPDLTNDNQQITGDLLYRSGTDSSDVENYGPNLTVSCLLVDKTVSVLKTAGQDQSTMTPPDDPQTGEPLTVDDWSLIVNPNRMGPEDGTAGDGDLKKAALVVTECSAVASTNDWTITGNYLWRDKNSNPMVTTYNASVDCLFIRNTVYDDSES